MTEVIGPAEILGFDPFAPSFRADPYPRYRELDAARSLARTPAGLWVTTGHELCERVLRDPGFGHRPAEGVVWRDAPARRRSFLTMDPPDHTRLRRLVGKAFTARLVERLRPRVEELVADLLDALPEGEPVDLLAALAYPLPVIMISELLGVPPEDRDLFKGWSDALARGLDPDFLLPAGDLAKREEARTEFAGYFAELAARRRAEPRDDLLSALVAVSDGGEVLSEADLLATCVLLLVAGHETTVNLIGNGALALLRHPDQLAWFRAHPDESAAAVEELLRYDPPVQLTLRSALEDRVVGGTPVPKGGMVLLILGAANRDPAVFRDPDRLDLTRYAGAGTGRAEAPRHLAFGHGIHFCLGAPLARLEGRIALRRLFEREVALADVPLTYRDNLVLRGLSALPATIGSGRPALG
ncbi:cytochrome P450 [Actinomadura sp. NBRC 104412]|uniref:cytochrome P450 n=1 Tax=Actinomadura sp. NBRC 104412 TaxID=3032203 RepID=UPI0024A2256B|nr:cytochrome P450 [Actinomadura sp. NBRC 104412]GLZ06361.1 cytochrome P450 [Actinomadura sp. NBRC 104412]